MLAVLTSSTHQQLGCFNKLQTVTMHLEPWKRHLRSAPLFLLFRIFLGLGWCVQRQGLPLPTLFLKLCLQAIHF